MLYGILLGIDVLVAIALIILVLLHRGKGAEAGAVFSGGGSSGAVFGAYGPQSFLSRMVAVLAAVFLITSLTLAYLANRDFTTRSVLDETATGAAATSTPTSTVDDIPAEGDGAEAMDGMDGGEAMDSMDDADAMDDMDGGEAMDSMDDADAMDSMDDADAMDSMDDADAMDSMDDAETMDDMPPTEDSR